ncbi:MAG: HAD family hydrolase [Anaerolineae bacterium]
MIEAFIFDLDGTLVQTEPMKNLAYLRAARELSSDHLNEAEILQACTDLIGVPAPETAMELVQRFKLEEAARARMAEFGVDSPWQAFSQLQLRHYNRLLDDTAALRAAQLSHNISLLHEVRARGYRTALATMSYRHETERVLEALGLAHAFEVVITQDDVQRGKPDPEIYLRVAQALAIPPAQCLVIEDSLSGVQAALAAGMWCIAVPTPLTSRSIHEAQVLDRRWIVDDPAAVKAVVWSVVEKVKREG